MSNENRERRTYRKSPGRQYTYEHNPLHNSNNAPQRSRHSTSRPGSSVERPDPKRTRQLLRQGILASKRPTEETTEQIHYRQHSYQQQRPIIEADPYPPASSLQPRRLGQEANMSDYPPPLSSGIRRRSAANARTEQDQELYQGRYNDYGHDDEYDDYDDYEPEQNAYEAMDDWQEPEEDEEIVEEEVGAGDRYKAENNYNYYQDVDDYESEYDSDDPDYESEPEAIAIVPSRRSQGLQRSPKATHKLVEEPAEYPLEYPAEDENYIYEYEEENPSVRPSRKRKRGVSRRGLLLGAGAAAVVGAGFAIHDLVPNTPAIPGTKGGPSVEQQVQNAFNQGMTQGANQARKELLDGLDTIEGFTLDGAIAAAQLTRKAYDVFVSPIIKFGSVVTSDFLTGMLNAFKTARSWLSSINQDNETLGAIQNVLESWVQQVSVLPTQLDQITETDLDGAQAYLRVLQQKINTEKAQLNATPTAAAQPKAAPTKKATP